MEESNLIHFKPIVTWIVESMKTKQASLCPRCIARCSNIMKVFNASLPTLCDDFLMLLDEDDQTRKMFTESLFCSLCLGLLSDQFVKTQVDILVEKIKNEEEQVESFQLQISLPTLMTLRNEYFAQLFGIKKDNYINLKELFRVLLTNQLEALLPVVYDSKSNLVIEMHYKHEDSDKECQQLVDSMPKIFFEKKCRKSTAASFINHSSILRSFQNLDSKELLDLQLLPINVGCTLEEMKIRSEPIFVAGRYVKLSRGLCQTPWIIDGQAVYKTSVQEIIQNEVAKWIQFKSFKFSASGREDVDVRMLGRGRPFLIELTHPRFSKDDNVLDKIKTSINLSKDVNVNDFQFVDKQCGQILKMGEEKKSKTYQAICCLDRKVTPEDVVILNGVENLEIIQPTPVRVLHRRTLADRTRTIHKMWMEPLEASELDPIHRPYIDQIFKLNLTCEAGSYIKEICHSDLGRTRPSLSTLLHNCVADIISLDVVSIDLDWPDRID